GKEIARLAPLIAGAFSVKEAVSMADAFTSLQAKLINANVAAGDMATTNKELFDIAKRNGSEIVSHGDLYGSLTMAAGELGVSQAQLMKATSGVASALKLSGSDAAQTSGVILQLG